MPTIEVVKTNRGELRGYGQENDEAFKRFKTFTKNLEPGEFFSFTYRRPRNIKFHRKYFALLDFLYDHWEPEQGRKRLTYKGHAIAKNREAFREQITILAGFYEQTFDLEGRMRLVAKSIAFDKMSEEEFAELYKATIDVGMKHILPRTYINAGEVDQVVLKQLEDF